MVAAKRSLADQPVGVQTPEVLAEYAFGKVAGGRPNLLVKFAVAQGPLTEVGEDDKIPFMG
jgi:hypothetical protein